MMFDNTERGITRNVRLPVAWRLPSYAPIKPADEDKGATVKIVERNPTTQIAKGTDVSFCQIEEKPGLSEKLERREEVTKARQQEIERIKTNNR